MNVCMYVDFLLVLRYLLKDYYDLYTTLKVYVGTYVSICMYLMYVYVLYMCVYVFGFHVTVLLSLIIISSSRITTEVPLLLSRHLLRCINKKFSYKTEMYFNNAIVYRAIISAGTMMGSYW